MKRSTQSIRHWVDSFLGMALGDDPERTAPNPNSGG